MKKKKMCTKRWTMIFVLALCCGYCLPAMAEIYKFQQGVDYGWGIYSGGVDITIDDPTTFETTQSDILRVQYNNIYPWYDEVHNTLIRFDGIEEMIGDASLIESATLTLAYKYTAKIIGRANLDLYPINREWQDPNWFSPWAEDGAQNDPNDRGDIMDTDISSGDMGDRTFSEQYITGQTFTFDLSVNVVRNWVEDPNSNFGVLLVMNPSFPTDVTFFSNDDPTNPNYHPLLTITMVGCAADLIADINDDCYVNIDDMVVLAGQWLSDTGGSADIYDSGDDRVDLSDFGLLQTQWLLCSDPTNPDCTCGKVSDLDGNCVLDILDLAIFAGEWTSTTGGIADIYPLEGDGKVNMQDFAVFIKEWNEQ